MNFYDKLMTNYRCGKCTVVKNDRGQFCTFSTPYSSGNLREGRWCGSEEEAMKHIGYFDGLIKETIDKLSKKEDWQIVKTIDFSDLGGEGYRVGEKVRILPDARKVNEKKGVDFASGMDAMVEDGYGYLSVVESGRLCILNKGRSDRWYFTPSSVEPFLEEDEILEVSIDEVADKFGVEVKNLKIKK